MKSVLHMLTDCPVCGNTYYRGLEGRRDGTKCRDCEEWEQYRAEEEPRVDDWNDPHESNPEKTLPR